MMAIPGILRKQLDEIAGSRVLRLYGVALALVHVVTFVFFVKNGNFFTLMSDSTDPVCWPFAPACHEWHVFSPSLVAMLLVSYLVLTLISAASFMMRGGVRRAFFLLLVVNILKYLMVIQNYQMMGNYHFMPFISTLVFLFLPDKLRMTRIAITAFYLAAGLLKFSSEWLTGSAMLFLPPMIHPWLMEMGFAYVIVLETIFSLGLLSGHRTLRWLAFAQFLAFHIVSYYWVGYFYPCVMALLISIFPLAWLLDPKTRSESVLFGAFGLEGRALSIGNYALLGIFAIMQAMPFLFSGDSAVTGEGRIFALNMYDAHAICDSSMLIRFKGQTVESAPAFNVSSVRIHCDPIVYYDRAHEACRNNRENPDFVDIDLFLYSKRVTDLNYRRVLALRDFCRKDPKYNIFLHNDWITDEIAKYQ